MRLPLDGLPGTDLKKALDALPLSQCGFLSLAENLLQLQVGEGNHDTIQQTNMAILNPSSLQVLLGWPRTSIFHRCVKCQRVDQTTYIDIFPQVPQSVPHCPSATVNCRYLNL